MIVIDPTAVTMSFRYYRNNTEQDGKGLYSLTWTLEFPYDGDTCYLAHCYPYTYSNLQHYLHEVISDPVRAAYCKLRVLCRSLAGNAVYVLTVTSPSTNLAERKAKRAVVVTARVHPGETNGSWMMQGFLEFLLSDLPDARLLREIFVFKVREGVQGTDGEWVLAKISIYAHAKCFMTCKQLDYHSNVCSGYRLYRC